MQEFLLTVIDIATGVGSRNQTDISILLNQQEEDHCIEEVDLMNLVDGVGKNMLPNGTLQDVESEQLAELSNEENTEELTTESTVLEEFDHL